jgi:cell wall-associated NlpC family hydrolase
MKYLSIIFCLLIAISTATPVLADLSMTDQIMQNASGDRIQILDGQNQQNQTQDEQPSDWQSKAQEILINAMSLTGIKYKYGGNSPNTGFDCSGFVRYVFSQAANLTLPPTARAISQIGKSVRKDDLQPGDLVFFNTLKSTFSHVGIYLGDNKFIHAPRTGGEVRVESMQNSYWQSHYNGAQRLDEEATKSLPVAQK